MIDQKNYTNFKGELVDFDSVYVVSKVVLGKGSFGEVRKGMNKVTGKPVAFKFQYDQDGSGDNNNHLFKQEIDILKKVKKSCEKYICLDGWGKMDGLYFLVMDLVKGTSLSKFRKKITSSQFLKIMKQLSDAVTWLHKSNIAHMDLKPDNIMIDQNLKINLIDLGLSCSSTLCGSGGTPYYMPDIPFESLSLSKRKALDYYALVMTLIEFHGKNVTSTRAQAEELIIRDSNTKVFRLVTTASVARKFREFVDKSRYFTIN
jgi:serine/threonine protein kinase